MDKNLFFYELEGRDMELIKELGGYEKAKSERDKINHSLNNGDFLGGGSPREYLYERLSFIEIDLLEYRRANNIFEVGDWAFPLIRIIDEIEGVGRFICAEKGELVVIREMKNKGAYCSHEHRLDNSFYMALSEFRHATEEEIKQVVAALRSVFEIK